jgi:hypothetical protein
MSEGYASDSTRSQEQAYQDFLKISEKTDDRLAEAKSVISGIEDLKMRTDMLSVLEQREGLLAAFVAV